MKVCLLALLFVASVAFGQLPPIPGGGGGGGTNNPPAYPPEFHPRPVVNGVIHTEDLDVIEWYNFSHHVFTVEHRLSLTDGSWVTLGEGYDGYEHNNPIGFYRVIENPKDVVFPVWNSGTTNMVWTASSSNQNVTVECLNTNIPPEWGEGYIVVRLPEGAGAVIDVYAGDLGGVMDQHMQCTVVAQ